jgi:anion-transporting  ArsA/GET3 family ATPase
VQTRQSILSGRLVIVTGKGGTGKTTVAAALAWAAASRGLRVVLAEVGREEQAPGLLHPGAPPVGYAGRELVPGLRAMRIDPFAALGEYIGLQLGTTIADRVVRNQGFRQLMTAAPGWRELITLGKVWHLEQQQAEGRPTVDLIVVDAPATGHGLTFLDVPHLVASAVRSGPLRRNASEVERLLRDPARTRLVPVALAEELPVRETHELLERLRERVGIFVDRVVVNAIEPDPLPPGQADLPARLLALGDAAPGRLRPATLAACIEHRQARHTLNRHYVSELARLTGLPLVELPYLAGGVHGPGELAALAGPLLAEPQPGEPLSVQPAGEPA